MQKTIEDLYYGNISPNEQLKPKVRGYQRKKQALLQSENAFLSELIQAHAEKYQELMFQQAELSSIELTQTFVDGFRLGMRLAFESFYGESQAGGSAPSGQNGAAAPDEKSGRPQPDEIRRQAEQQYA